MKLRKILNADNAEWNDKNMIFKIGYDSELIAPTELLEGSTFYPRPHALIFVL